MQASSIPLRFQKAWAQGASGAYIRTVPVASQIGIQDGAASYTDGFPPDNFLPVAAGGVPPFGQDMNGLMNETTSWDQWYQVGGAIPFNSAFATAIGGYPAGCVIASALVLGKKWLSLVDNNTTDPDSSGASGWVQSGCLLTGVPFASFSTSAEPQCVLANGLTVGNAASNGTARANADTWFLFAKLWALSASACPIFTSAGAGSTRGANAAADFAANKALGTPTMKGSGVIGADTMGGSASTFLTGVPVTFGNATTPASILGENMHTLTIAETPVITPAGTIAINSISNVGILTGGSVPQTGPVQAFLAQSVTPTGTFTGTPHGGGGSHNTVERNTVIYWNLPL